MYVFFFHLVSECRVMFREKIDYILKTVAFFVVVRGYLFVMEIGDDHTIVIYALINKTVELKEGVHFFSHDCTM